jgi:hypothetical protein
MPTPQLSAGHAVVPHVVDDDSGVSSHALVPSQSLSRHAVSAHVISSPSHTLPLHVSPYVHESRSSQPGLVRHCHAPPTFVQ